MIVRQEVALSSTTGQGRTGKAENKVSRIIISGRVRVGWE